MNGRVHQENQERGGQHHLRQQHRLGLLPRLALEVGESAAARSFSSFTWTSSPSTPSACHGVCPVILALARASLIRQNAQPSPISLAAISASGTPRPPDRFI